MINLEHYQIWKNTSHLIGNFLPFQNLFFLNHKANDKILLLYTGTATKKSIVKEFRDFKKISLKELQDMIRKANSISKKDEKMLIDTIKLFLLS